MGFSPDQIDTLLDAHAAVVEEQIARAEAERRSRLMWAVIGPVAFALLGAVLAVGGAGIVHHLGWS